MLRVDGTCSKRRRELVWARYTGRRRNARPCARATPKPALAHMAANNSLVFIMLPCLLLASLVAIACRVRKRNAADVMRAVASVA